MPDFETHPVGTAAELARLRAKVARLRCSPTFTADDLHTACALAYAKVAVALDAAATAVGECWVPITDAAPFAAKLLREIAEVSRKAKPSADLEDQVVRARKCAS